MANVTTEQLRRGRLEDLPAEECLELLRSRHVGRVVYDAGGPVVVPVNYVVDEGTVLFPTSAHSSLGQRVTTSVAVFQVDEIHVHARSGWSVLVRGPATYVDGQDLPSLDVRPVPWLEELQLLHVRITPRLITGRRLVPVEPADPSEPRTTPRRVAAHL